MFFCSTHGGKYGKVDRYNYIDILLDIKYYFLCSTLGKGGAWMARHKTPASDYKQVLLRLPEDLITELRVEAEEIGRPLNTHVIRLLRAILKQRAEERVGATTTGHLV
jgi:hypothetical protein